MESAELLPAPSSEPQDVAAVDESFDEDLIELMQFVDKLTLEGNNCGKKSKVQCLPFPHLFPKPLTPNVKSSKEHMLRLGADNCHYGAAPSTTIDTVKASSTAPSSVGTNKRNSSKKGQILENHSSSVGKHADGHLGDRSSGLPQKLRDRQRSIDVSKINALKHAGSGQEAWRAFSGKDSADSSCCEEDVGDNRAMGSSATKEKQKVSDSVCNVVSRDKPGLFGTRIAFELRSPSKKRQTKGGRAQSSLKSSELSPIGGTRDNVTSKKSSEKQATVNDNQSAEVSQGKADLDRLARRLLEKLGSNPELLKNLEKLPAGEMSDVVAGWIAAYVSSHPQGETNTSNGSSTKGEPSSDLDSKGQVSTPSSPTTSSTADNWAPSPELPEVLATSPWPRESSAAIHPSEGFLNQHSRGNFRQSPVASSYPSASQDQHHPGSKERRIWHYDGQNPLRATWSGEDLRPFHSSHEPEDVASCNFNSNSSYTGADPTGSHQWQGQMSPRNASNGVWSGASAGESQPVGYAADVVHNPDHPSLIRHRQGAPDVLNHKLQDQVLHFPYGTDADVAATHRTVDTSYTLHGVRSMPSHGSLNSSSYGWERASSSSGGIATSSGSSYSQTRSNNTYTQGPYFLHSPREVSTLGYSSGPLAEASNVSCSSNGLPSILAEYNPSCMATSIYSNKQLPNGRADQHNTGGRNQVWHLVVDTNIIMSPEQMKAMESIKVWGETNGFGTGGAMKGDKYGALPGKERVVVIVPQAVPLELDGLKKNEAKQQAAQRALKFITDTNRANTSWFCKQSPTEEVKPELPSSLQNHRESSSSRNDTAVLACALYFQRHVNPERTVLLTCDLGLQAKAQFCNVYTETAGDFVAGRQYEANQERMAVGQVAYDQGRWDHVAV